METPELHVLAAECRTMLLFFSRRPKTMYLDELMEKFRIELEFKLSGAERLLLLKQAFPQKTNKVKEAVQDVKEEQGASGSVIEGSGEEGRDGGDRPVTIILWRDTPE